MNQPSLQELGSIERSPDILSGVWRFRGTRVTVAALCENLRDGVTVADFLAWFPGVTLARVEDVLDYEARTLQGSTAP